MLQGYYVTIVGHLSVALIAGSLIGYERSYQGRPAGFRTHALVCMASSLLMLVSLYQNLWFEASVEIVRVDPTRMAQGIMTGIGFLGAGVIVKEGASVRGLTTAASIWITAAIGILAGIGFYFPVIVVTALTLFYLQHSVRFPLHRAIPETEYCEFIAEQGLKSSEFSYHASVEAGYMEYHMVLSSRNPGAERRLAKALTTNPDVLEFKLALSGE
jgi:putative Mg2+ transporter-C (MgtC) family protein